MIGKELIELYNKGLRPVVKFTKEVEDLDMQFEEGMIAKIVNISKDKHDENLYEVTLDETEFKKFNLDMEAPVCENRKTGNYDLKWSECNKRYDRETLYIEINEELCNFEIMPDAYSELVNEYLDSKTDLTYVEWLQEKLLELRALQ